MNERTGSYPLMNLASDYGVDYGDVLIWAEYLRLSRTGKRDGEFPPHFPEAIHRICMAVTHEQQEALCDAMVDRANARWGAPPVIWL